MKKNQLQYLFVSIYIIVSMISCSSNEIGESKDVNQETIYQSYQLEFNEKDKEASIFCQFRFAGENGTTLVLNSPSTVAYNGKLLKVDSNTFNGAFYRTTIPYAKAIGKHSVVFTDTKQKRYENSFEVDSFYLTAIPAGISKKAPALIRFKAPALEGDDYILLESEGTDSSFSVMHKAGENVDYITIPVTELQRQKTNEFFVTSTLHRKIKLQQQAKEGGEIITVQTLKPVKLILVDETP
jgi:hypothetical protein